MTALNGERERQEEQYRFPYHHLIRYDDGAWRWHEYWAWGFRYSATVEMILDAVEPETMRSAVDVGCGDGRLATALKGRLDQLKVVGVDHSRTAIRYARAFCPTGVFVVGDAAEYIPGGGYDCAFAVEVLEHIHPGKVRAVLDNIHASLQGGGRFVGSVPHSNVEPSSKHYQHFSRDQLEGLLQDRFEKVEITFLDRKSWILSALFQLLGGKGENFIITNRKVRRLFYRIYKSHFAVTPDEERCTRMFFWAQREE